jgi:putative endonuclease
LCLVSLNQSEDILNPNCDAHHIHIPYFHRKINTSSLDSARKPRCARDDRFLTMTTEHIYYVYFMQSSSRRALYIGMTSNLHRRVYQHKTKEFRGFTFDYDSVRLVYWESYDDVHKAIGREKQLKRWRREKKLWLIARTNPQFRDLSADWYGKEVIKAWGT